MKTIAVLVVLCVVGTWARPQSLRNGKSGNARSQVRAVEKGHQAEKELLGLLKQSHKREQAPHKVEQREEDHHARTGEVKKETHKELKNYLGRLFHGGEAEKQAKKREGGWRDTGDNTDHDGYTRGSGDSYYTRGSGDIEYHRRSHGNSKTGEKKAVEAQKSDDKLQMLIKELRNRLNEMN